MRKLSLAVLGIFGGSCSSGETHACDEGTPTCDSSLIVLLPDPRTDFEMTLEDDVGMDFTVTCPLAEGEDGVFDEYSVICGGGRLTITTFLYFGDTVDVQLDKGTVRTLPVEQQRGADFCGNSCTVGTAQLN